MNAGMNIVIIGAGAMGSLFGALLSRSDADILLVDKRSDHVQAIQQHGLHVVGVHPETTVQIKAVTQIVPDRPADLIILFVKAYDTRQALLDCLKLIGPDTTILTLQNGLGNIEAIRAIAGSAKVVAGTTSYGCLLPAPGSIKVSNAGEVTLGELDGTFSGRITRLAGLFHQAGVSVQVTDNVRGLIWTKLAVNVGINALSAITSLTNGELLAHSGTRQLMQMAISELAAVAAHKNIALLTEPVQLAVKVAQDTYTNKSSMLQDLERGSRTEIDHINGAVVAEGLKDKIAVPVNQVLTSLIKVLEDSRMRNKRSGGAV
ncbi:2-dehydropantoate 2-reductase [Dendrosporobacter quercicolus]|uniref:2-dehydropantoate 2-reductase n=2 Tax=Dendrosporobacter quercicolus TaxID=146817 RepID=A0A1G9RX94_9FIRM|nr:2-dehydropantoate 2-reductase [Dendrosporobacter quercicolus]